MNYINMLHNSTGLNIDVISTSFKQIRNKHSSTIWANSYKTFRSCVVLICRIHITLLSIITWQFNSVKLSTVYRCPDVFKFLENGRFCSMKCMSHRKLYILMVFKMMVQKHNSCYKNIAEVCNTNSIKMRQCNIIEASS